MIFVLASDGGSPLLLALQSVDWQLVLVEWHRQIPLQQPISLPSI